MLNEIFFLINRFLNTGVLIPWINFLDLQGYMKRMKVLRRKFDGFLEHVLDEHNDKRIGVEEYVAEDMVDVLLQLAEDPTLMVKLERHSVKSIYSGLCGYFF